MQEVAQTPGPGPRLVGLRALRAPQALSAQNHNPGAPSDAKLSGKDVRSPMTMLRKQPVKIFNRQSGWLQVSGTLGRDLVPEGQHLTAIRSQGVPRGSVQSWHILWWGLGFYLNWEAHRVNRTAQKSSPKAGTRTDSRSVF